MTKHLVNASKGDPSAAAAIAAIDVPWAAAPDYSQMILVQRKLAVIDSQGLVRVLNDAPKANSPTHQCADLYEKGPRGSSWAFTPLPTSFWVKEIRYVHGRFEFISTDHRSVRGTLAQISQAMSEVRFALGSVSESQLEESFLRISSTVAVPPRLRRTAVENREFIDEIVGMFTFDEVLQRFVARFRAGESTIDVVVESNDRAEALALMSTVRRLVRNLDEVARVTKGFAASELLSLKNRAWLDDRERPLSQADFVSRLLLESVSVGDGGEATVWYGDGGMFLGHEVVVSLSAEGDPVGVTLAG